MTQVTRGSECTYLDPDLSVPGPTGYRSLRSRVFRLGLHGSAGQVLGPGMQRVYTLRYYVLADVPGEWGLTFTNGQRERVWRVSKPQEPPEQSK